MFKTFWTLKIINSLFIISCIACLALALASFSGTAAPYMQVTDGILALLTLLGVRLTFECIAVQFVQAETLQKILNKLEKINWRRRMKPKIPDWVKKKAELYERLYREGLKRARRIQRNDYLSMSLSLCWRMLSKDNGQSWKTMSHATYDTQIKT